MIDTRLEDKLMVAPLPEVTDGQVWNITGGGVGQVSFKNHRMVVPLSSSEKDAFSRLHEMGHAKWSPRDRNPSADAQKLGVSPDFIQCTEDARIHCRLAQAGFTDVERCGALSDEMAKQLVEHCLEQPDPLTPYTTLLLSTVGTKDAERIVKALGNMIAEPKTPGGLRDIASHVNMKSVQIVREGLSIMHRGARKHLTPEYKDTLATAKYLKTVLDSTPKHPPKPPPKQPGAVTVEKDDEMEAEDEALEKIRDNWSQTAQPPELNEDGSNKWGPMKINILPLSVPCKGAITGRRVRAHDTGAIPRFMHRMCTDQMIFGQKKRCPGGTVLIDASGSMNIPDADIDFILTKAPAATIAMYSGNADRGELSILARNGHRANAQVIAITRARVGGNNMVDGPALLWLAKQEEPRFWVSDGMATGLDGYGPALVAECMATAKRNRIRRVPSMEEAKVFFERLVQKRGDISAATTK